MGAYESINEPINDSLEAAWDRLTDGLLAELRSYYERIRRGPLRKRTIDAVLGRCEVTLDGLRITHATSGDDAVSRSLACGPL
jgi:hypothetical protein